MKSFEEILQTIKKTLQIEGESVLLLQKYVNRHTYDAVHEIFIMRGRLVVTGVGKSAIIAQKLVATFNSTGTPALFMHAADAIHGDLGMILPQDIVLCLSQSGNTPEIKALIPIIKARGNLLIGMVGAESSYLAQQANFCLLTKVEKEACPLNLAPTSSSTAQLAMGDALAVALMEMRNFTLSDFGKSHPGGALGRRIYLRVGDIQVSRKATTILPDASFNEVLEAISASFVGATVVMEQNKLYGIITDGDVRRALSQNLHALRKKAISLCTPNPKTIEAHLLAIEALALMQKENISQLIVFESGKFKGILHIHDLLREGIL